MPDKESTSILSYWPILLIGALIVIWPYAKDESNNQAIVKKAKKDSIRQVSDVAVSKQNLMKEKSQEALRAFYSNCLSVKELRVKRTYGVTSAKIYVELTNRTGYPIEAMIFGLQIEDKLGNRISQSDLYWNKKVDSQKTGLLIYDWPQTFDQSSGFQNYRQDELTFLFLPPFSAVKFDKYDTRSSRTSDIVVRFSDGTGISDLKGWTGYSLGQLETQVRYLDLLR